MAVVKDMLIEKYDLKVDVLARLTGHDCDFLWDLWMDVLVGAANIDDEDQRWLDFCEATLKSDWSYGLKISELAYCTGYDYDYLCELWMDILMDPTDTDSEEEKWSYFKGVTLEFDW